MPETSIKSLGKLKKMGGHLHCEGAKTLEDLGKLEEVGGHCNMGKTQIKTLGFLKKVGGNLDCEGLGTLESIGDLEEIGGDILIRGIALEGYRDIIKKIKRKELVFKNDIYRIYNKGKLNYEKFREMYGENIMGIEDKEIRKIASLFLIIEYEEFEKVVKEELYKIRVENEGKELTEEEKIGLREGIKELGMRLKRGKVKIEKFGISLDNL